MNTTFSKQKIIECQKQFDQHNNAWESKHMGNYRLVYSKENESVYKKYFHRNESPLYRNSYSFSSQQFLKNMVQKKVYLILYIQLFKILMINYYLSSTKN